MLLFCFSACRLKAEQKSLTDEFIAIDTLIDQNQMKLAVDELKKTEKRASDVWSYIGVYKRYARLGETELAEKCLKKALKEYKKNDELNAIYTDFLLNEKRFDEAESFGKKLLGTDYASLYSEAFLRTHLDLTIKDDDFDIYTVYYNAYLTSKNPVWIKNCAILDMLLGKYDNIPNLVPSAFADVDDAFFWALALYDSGRYYESIEVAKRAQSLLNDFDKSFKFKISEVDIIALLSDSYLIVSNNDAAEKIRKDFILNLKSLDKAELKSDLIPIIFINSALWAYNQELYDKSVDLLLLTVKYWPDFVPGLILYSDYAYKSNQERIDNMEESLLRESGLATVEMEKYDSRRKIPISDAQHRVEEALKRTNSPYLRIVQLDMKYKLDNTLTVKEKTGDLWKMLESSYSENEEYKGLLIQYALNFLLKTQQYDDAWDLFYQYVVSNIDYDPEVDFWEQFIGNVRSFDSSIAEFGAWFAAFKNLYTEAIRLNEYCVFESGGLPENAYLSKNVSTATCMNLADIYYSKGKYDKALDLYGKIGSRESKKSLRSDIFYRLACVYSSAGDKKNALRSVEYACELYPENSRASLLKDNLRKN